MLTKKQGLYSYLVAEIVGLGPGPVCIGSTAVLAVLLSVLAERAAKEPVL